MLLCPAVLSALSKLLLRIRCFFSDKLNGDDDDDGNDNDDDDDDDDGCSS